MRKQLIVWFDLFICDQFLGVHCEIKKENQAFVREKNE